ncbi:MAG: chloride channel protein [Streptosporangiaceae bacterium]
MTSPDRRTRRPGPSHWLSLARTRQPARASERRRRPQPLLKQRLPSGRGATEQPNITSGGADVFTPRFWVMVALTGVAAGLLGALMMLILFNVQYAAFGYHSGSFQHAVERAPAVRRVSSLLIAGVFGGVAWFLLRRYNKGEPSEIDEALWSGDGRLSFRRCLGTSVISEVVIGMGASIGREAAPKLLGGAFGSVLAGWGGLSVQQRRLLVACGGGAGLAAVYNVPLAGALFTAEILIGSISLPVMLPALACSLIATATAWIYLPDHAVYPGIPDYPFTWSVMTWAVLAGPVIGLVSAGYIRLIGWVSYHRARGSAALISPVLAFGILGVIGIWYPQLFGNGLDIARDALLGIGGFSLMFTLFALKPLVTAMCLGGGASGGLFTPTLATGAVLGGALGIAWNLAWPGSPSGAFAMVGAAAMIGAAMQAPLSGLVLVLELTHSGFGLMVPMMAATGIATLVAFHIDGYSIYSARLPAYAADSAPAAPAEGRNSAHGDHGGVPPSQTPPATGGW